MLKRKRYATPLTNDIMCINDLGFVTYKNIDIVDEELQMENFWKLLVSKTKQTITDQICNILCITNYKIKSQTKKMCSVFIPTSKITFTNGIMILYIKNHDRSLSILGAIRQDDPALLFGHIVPFGTLISNTKLTEEYKSIRMNYLYTKLNEIHALNHNVPQSIDYDMDVDAPVQEIKSTIQLLLFDEYQKPPRINSFVTTFLLNTRIKSIYENSEQNIQSKWYTLAKERPIEAMFADFLICIASSSYEALRKSYIEGYASCASMNIRSLETPYERQHAFTSNGFVLDPKILYDKYGQNVDSYFYDVVRKRTKLNIEQCKKRFNIEEDGSIGDIAFIDEQKYSWLVEYLKKIYILLQQIMNKYEL